MDVEAMERTLGDNVRAVRLSRRLTQTALAERANVSLGALKHLEQGSGATTRTLVKVLRALSAEDWLATLAPPAEPFDPMKMLEARQRQEKPKGPRRVRTEVA